MIEDFSVDLLLVQESYPHDEHLPPLLFSQYRKQSVWSRAGTNTWGSAIFSATGKLTPIEISTYQGWVVGAEIRNASWQSSDSSTFVLSLHTPDGEGSYSGQVNRILDEVAKVIGDQDVIIGGDFNLTISKRCESERKLDKHDLKIQQRLSQDFDLMNCWQEANPDQPLHQTLRWSRDRTIPFHCDGIFVPRIWQESLTSCDVLAGEDWNQLSDHNPVLASFEDKHVTNAVQ